MANERLRAAMIAAQVDVHAIADATGVDPKTAQRWIGGRVPHPRHRWTVAKVLREREDYLWPTQATPSAHPGVAQTAEVVAAYGQRADVPPAAWRALFADAERQIDLLGYALHFLPELLPDFPALLQRKAAAGCQIRIALGDPKSARIRERDEEERLGGTLAARILATLRHLRELQGKDGIALRFHDAPLYNSVFRADDQMHVTPHLFSVHGSRAPLLHLRRLSPHGVFAGFASHVDAIWANAYPIDEESDLTTATAHGNAHVAH
jgi:hypothetical protein